MALVVFTKLKLTQVSIILSPTSHIQQPTFVVMALSLLDLPAELICRIFNFIPSDENAIIPIRKTCRALALITTEIFARKYFSLGSWRLTPRAVSALTGISKNKVLNPTLKYIALFQYTSKYQKYDPGSLAKGIDIKELGQSLQTLANLRSFHLAKFNFRGSEKFLGDLLATLSLPSITNFYLSDILAHAGDLQKFIALHSDTIDTVAFDGLDLTAPAKGAWSGLLGSLTQLKDVELIHIRKPLKCGHFVRFEPKDEEDSIFERYVQVDREYDDCGCLICFEFAERGTHWVLAEYRLGTDVEVEEEDWTRGLGLMAAGSRSIHFSFGSDLSDGDPDPDP